ncbi:phage tail tape measure protein [Bacteroides ovatus]|uniref:phage tail tape measure protein n=1 Tax=Bacteroides ovatus TaxID=28116 RepID=UPI0018C9AC28|nr:phage tail tape measure protein [Bacteroides ovatus]MBG9217344.1 phage tail tape measure protein [Bacteroides ovatus]MBG9231535.1 phage tail tape measure protein [Bacteroides ovatus]
MGIQNKDGALYFATGIDNSGLYSGRQEAMGIIKAMAGEITAFDVFGGIGISAGIAFTQAAKEAYNFEKQFQQSMKEVATLSSGIKGSLTDFMNSVIDMTREVPVGAVESAKALYQIVSAGHDGADAMNILKVSAKAAIGGVTETATSADAITTILNAYKKGASEAENISDMLFTTAKLGKTTMGELGRSIAQAAPIASSFGIDIEDVLAAVVSITKQGVPTAEAMTKIRAAIMGTANHLGDAAFSGRSFQEALQLIYNEANGSTTKMKELLGTDEALQAALMITGQNAVGAASDLDQMKNASGAAEAAFKEMSSSAENQMKLLGNNITAALRPMGEAILKEISSIATAFNNAFENGNAQEAIKTLGTLIVTLTSAFVGYKGSIIAINAIKEIHISLLEMEKYEMLLYRKAVEAGTISENALTAAQVKQMATRRAMVATIKLHTATLLKNAKAMLANPYVLAAAAAAALGYAIYKYSTRATAAEKAQKQFNKTVKESQQRANDYKNKIQELVSIARSDAAATTERYKALFQLQRLMKSVFKDMDLKKLKDMDDLELTNKIAEAEARRNVVITKTNLAMAKQRLQKIDNQIILTNNRGGYTGALKEDREAVAKEVDLLQGEVDRAVKTHSISIKSYVQSQKEAAIQNRAFWTKQKEDATKALESIASAQKKQMDAGKFKGIDSAVVKSYKENVKKLKEAEKELKVYDSSSKQDDQAHKLREEQEKYKLLLDKQSREQQRMKEDSANELEQLEINKLKESSEKVLRQRKLNHKLELQAIEREADDKKLKVIEDARSAFEANPQNKKKTFNSSAYIKSEPVKKQFAAFDKVANEKKETTDLKYNRGDDLADLLNQYQDYTDKRLAIERKFNEDIATLQEQRKQAVKNGDTEQVEQIGRSIAQATKNKGMELMNLDYDKLKESPEYVRAFENLKETSSETLNSLLNQLENAKSAAAKVLSPDQLREYTSTIQSIMDELDSRNPFQSLSDKKKELAEAEEELANAQMELENARQTAEAVKGGAKIENGIKSSKFNAKTGKIDSTKSYLSEAQALDKVKEKTDNYNEAKDKTAKASSKVQSAERKVTSVIGELSDSLKGLGSAIGGQAGEIINLIGDIGNFAMTAMAGVEGASTTTSTAIKTVEKASVILAIIGAAVQIATKIFDMFSKDDTTEKYEKAKEAYESYINILDRVIEKQLELAETLTGDTANAVYEAAIANIKLQSENAKVLGKQYLNSGASGKSHSKGYDEVDDMSGEGWKQAAKALGMSVNEFKNKMGGRMTGLFDLTDEQLLKLQSDAGIFWSQLDSDTQKFADQIANGVGKIAEVLEQQIADTTLIDYDSLRSDFQDLLSDMDADSADFADNFEDYMRNAILNSMLKDEFMDRLTAWREKLYNAMDDGVTEDEYNALKAEGQQIADEMKARRDAMSDIYKWDKDDDEREASKKGFASMSQDSADKLDGSFAVMTSHTYSINEEVKSINSGTEKIAEKLSYLINMDKNMSEMLRCNDTIVSHLSDISNYTSNLVEIREFMYAVKLGIDTLNTKGITLKR